MPPPWTQLVNDMVMGIDVGGRVASLRHLQPDQSKVNVIGLLCTTGVRHPPSGHTIRTEQPSEDGGVR